MNLRKRQTIEQWIKEALEDGDKGKPCSAISCVLIKNGIGQEEIHTKPIEGGTADPKQLASFFINKATGYAQDLPGMTTFKLLAFYGGEPLASFPFTVSEGQLTAGERVAFESNERGVLGQLMNAYGESTRQNKELAQALANIGQHLAGTSLVREKEIQAERVEMTTVMRDMLLSFHKETHEMRLNELEYARSSEERRMIGKAIPSIANYMMGREVIPEAHADTELFEGLLEKVKPEHIQILTQMGIITPPMDALLMQRIVKLKEDKEKRAAAMKALPGEVDTMAEMNGKDHKGELQ